MLFRSDPQVVDLARRLSLSLNDGRFAATSPFSPVATSRPGIFVCGAFQGPKDIPLSVMEASAAAGKAMDKIRDRFGESAVALGRAMA